MLLPSKKFQRSVLDFKEKIKNNIERLSGIENNIKTLLADKEKKVQKEALFYAQGAKDLLRFASEPVRNKLSPLFEVAPKTAQKALLKEFSSFSQEDFDLMDAEITGELQKILLGLPL